MAKIAFFELEGWEEPILKKEFSSDELFLSDKKLEEYDGSAGYDFEIVSVFVNSKLDHDAIRRFPNLKCIATRSTGYDHIALDVCKDCNVEVVFVPGYGDNTVAEFAFGLILSLTRKIYAAIDQIKETGKFSFTGFRGMDIKGKTMGVIGTGRIGKEMVKIAKGFGMEVVAYDPYPSNEFAKEMGYRYVSLEELLKTSDVVSLHVPLLPETEHLINGENIKLMKKGSYLVNTARGGLVETGALMQALADGTLAGAGLDVLEEEGEIKDEMKLLKESNLEGGRMKTIIENQMLMRMPNVLMTPHNAFNTQEALERILATTIENVKGFLSGTVAPKNIVKE